MAISLTDQVPFDVERPDAGLLGSIVFSLPTVSDVPGWWSTERDRWLRDEWINHDALKVAVSVFVSKVAAVPLAVVSKNSRRRNSQRDESTV